MVGRPLQYLAEIYDDATGSVECFMSTNMQHELHG
jgi:hypothetical protein